MPECKFSIGEVVTGLDHRILFDSPKLDAIIPGSPDSQVSIHAGEVAIILAIQDVPWSCRYLQAAEVMLPNVVTGWVNVEWLCKKAPNICAQRTCA